jgi:hypothetical protein
VWERMSGAAPAKASPVRSDLRSMTVLSRGRGCKITRPAALAAFRAVGQWGAFRPGTRTSKISFCSYLLMQSFEKYCELRGASPTDTALRLKEPQRGRCLHRQLIFMFRGV